MDPSLPHNRKSHLRFPWQEVKELNLTSHLCWVKYQPAPLQTVDTGFPKMVSMLTAEDFRISSIKDNFSICSPQIGKHTAKPANHCSKEQQCGQGMGLLSPKNRLKHGILHKLWSKIIVHATHFLARPPHLCYNSSLNISLGPSWQSPTASLAQILWHQCI